MHNISDWAERLADAIQDELAVRTREPEATYRLQFDRGQFSFQDAAAVVPYLQELGISHVYSSPYLKARSGSPHGYDIVDHRRLDPELGGPETYEEFVEALHARGMGHVLDLVPNHMGIATNENAWWNDVLENGPSSPYSHFFDIDWQPIKAELKNKVLLPLLGDQYGRILESGQLQLGYRDGAFFLQYYENTLPLEPSSYTRILSHRLNELKRALPADAEELLELESIITALDYLPDYTETDPDRIAERQREKEVVKGRLRRLTGDSSTVAEFLERNLQEFNGDPSDPRSFDLLDELLNAQVFRLAHWKAASDEINYRRFFDINDLAAICMEDPEVFEAAHRLVFELLVRGHGDGLRIDHIDGLFDPTEYLWRLQWGYLRALGRAAYETLCADHRAAQTAPEALREPSSEAPASSPASEIEPPPLGSATEAASPAVAVMDRVEPHVGGTDGEPPPDWKDIEPVFLEKLWQHVGGLPPTRVFPRWEVREERRPGEPEAGEEDVDQLSHRRALVGGWSERPLPFRARAVELRLPRYPLYVLVEKILEPDEPLPRDWPIAGSTGYDYLNLVNGLFVDPSGLREVIKIYNRYIRRQRNFSEVAYQSKLLILRVSMASELQLLTHRLNRLSEKHRRTRDFTFNSLRMALREILACFPVYRSYIGAGGISERDRHFLHAAVATAKRRNPALDAALFDFIRDTLLLQQPPSLDEQARREREFFIGRFQQVTSPVMAKGVEDTAYYRSFPLASLNEVGGAPAHGSIPADQFHRENRARQSQHPKALVCTTTHDTKRSEDVRARINVLSEIPRHWRTALSRWTRFNRRHRRQVNGEPAPSRNDEYLFYQSLIGIWPVEDRAPGEGDGGDGRVHEPRRSSALSPEQHEEVLGRLQGYMEKATHEAKVRTSWINPSPDYDSAVRDFVAAVLRDSPDNRFLADFLAFHEKIVDWGLYNALSQLLLKLASPGVPDVYQGQEIWNFSLVDPDNRRPVNFDRCHEMLQRLKSDVSGGDEALLELSRHLAGHPRDSRAKLFLTWRTLQFRRAAKALFERGRYVPLESRGSRADHVCSFVWRYRPEDADQEQIAVVVVPRLIAQLSPWPEDEAHPPPPLGPSIWHDTHLLLGDLPPVPLKNLFTGRVCNADQATLPLAEVLSDFPVAVLTNVEV